MNCALTLLPSQPTAVSATPAAMPPAPEPPATPFGRALALLLEGIGQTPAQPGSLADPGAAAGATLPGPADTPAANAGPNVAINPASNAAAGPVIDAAASPAAPEPAAPASATPLPLPIAAPAEPMESPAGPRTPRRQAKDDTAGDADPVAPAAVAVASTVVLTAGDPPAAQVPAAAPPSDAMTQPARGPATATQPIGRAVERERTFAQAAPSASDSAQPPTTPSSAARTPASALHLSTETSHDAPQAATPQSTVVQHAAAQSLATVPQGDATPTAAAPAASTAAPASPAAQLAPALVSVVHAANGEQHLTVRLEPAELGQVEVHVDRSAGAPVRVDVTVQRPETLTLLLRDQPQLQRALDQAGLPADGRSLTFHIAPSPATPVAASHGSGFANTTAGGAGAGGQSGSGGQQQGTPRGMPTTMDDVPDDMPPTLMRWLRAGIDITA